MIEQRHDLYCLTHNKLYFRVSSLFPSLPCLPHHMHFPSFGFAHGNMVLQDKIERPRLLKASESPITGNSVSPKRILSLCSKTGEGMPFFNRKAHQRPSIGDDFGAYCTLASDMIRLFPLPVSVACFMFSR